MAALPVTWTGPDVVAVGLNEADGEDLVVIPAGLEDSGVDSGVLTGTTVTLTTGMVTVPLLVTE
jgi:galactitol-specific phosphotransferase system IIC component